MCTSVYFSAEVPAHACMRAGATALKGTKKLSRERCFSSRSIAYVPHCCAVISEGPSGECRSYKKNLNYANFPKKNRTPLHFLLQRTISICSSFYYCRRSRACIFILFSYKFHSFFIQIFSSSLVLLWFFFSSSLVLNYITTPPSCNVTIRSV